MQLIKFVSNSLYIKQKTLCGKVIIFTHVTWLPPQIGIQYEKCELYTSLIDLNWDGNKFSKYVALQIPCEILYTKYFHAQFNLIYHLLCYW